MLLISLYLHYTDIFMEIFTQLDNIENISENIKITKSIGGIDVSNRNAFSSNDKIKISLHVKRKFGITSVTFVIARDGAECRYYKMPLEFSYASDDVFSFELDAQNLCYPENCGLYYYKLVINQGKDSYQTSTINNIDFNLRRGDGACFKMLLHTPEYKTPDRFKNSIMYHIFVDRFNKGSVPVPVRDDAIINPDWENGIPEYQLYPGAPLKNNEFFGGTLWGIIEKLDYLAELGVKTIYLSPIFKAYSNHKYDTGNYLEVDEMFGGDEAFMTLIKQADKHSMKIVLDGVFNHTGDNSIYFNKYNTYDSVGAFNSSDSKYRNWYFFKDNNNYDSWWGIDILPKLNHQTLSCRRYFTGESGIAQKYVEAGIGGWRLDVADELSNEFLDEFREVVKDKNQDAIIIGEVWENAADKVAYSKRRRYFQGKQLDSVMNYPFKNALIEYMKTENADVLYNELVDIYSSYPKCVCDSLMNLLGTHDTERILTVLSMDRPDGRSMTDIANSKLSEKQRRNAIEKLLIASTVQYTVYGFPSVFYGDEAGIEGYSDPFCRKPFPWNNISQTLHSHYVKLGKIRNSNEAFNGGEFDILYHNNGTIIYKRQSEDSKILICVNASGYAENVSIDGEYYDLYNEITVKNIDFIKPMSFLILKEI